MHTGPLNPVLGLFCAASAAMKDKTPATAFNSGLTRPNGVGWGECEEADRRL